MQIRAVWGANKHPFFTRTYQSLHLYHRHCHRSRRHHHQICCSQSYHHIHHDCHRHSVKNRCRHHNFVSHRHSCQTENHHSHQLEKRQHQKKTHYKWYKKPEPTTPSQWCFWAKQSQSICLWSVILVYKGRWACSSPCISQKCGAKSTQLHLSHTAVAMTSDQLQGSQTTF